MQRSQQSVLLSPSDLTTFLGCRHASALDLRALDDPELERSPADGQLELLQEKGDEHERAYLARLKEQGVVVEEIPAIGPRADRVEATAAAMSRGVDAIFQASFLQAPWLGYADFLRRVPVPSGLGAWSYEPVDTKLARSGSARHVVQLGIYARLIAEAQGRLPGEMHLVLGDSETRTYRVAEFDAYVAAASRRLEAFCAGAAPETYPEPCAHCEVCHWRARCEQQWASDDHLSQVAGVRRTQWRKLESAGVGTVAALAALDEATRVPRLAAATLARLQAQAQLQVRAREEGAEQVELLAAEPGRGFARMPPPAAGDLYFDIEGDPLYDGQLEYLFGLHWMEGGEARHERFWAHDRAAEGVAVGALLDFVAAHLKRYPDAFVYHYNHYEITALDRLTGNHATHEDVFIDLLRRQRFVDLYKVVRESVRTSRPGLSLKELEKLYRGQGREGGVTTAGDSIVIYERWRQSGEQALLDEIAHYNEDDCVSTRELRDWLRGYRPAESPWFAPGASESDEAAAERAARQAEAQARLDAVIATARGGLADSRQRVRALLEQLADFHRREKRPQWRALFERMGFGADELEEDVECIAGLTACADVPPEPVKRSTVYSYDFPPQEYKLGEGKDCYLTATGERAGTIHYLDADRRRLGIRRGNRSEPLPETLSIGPPMPIADDVLRDAVWRFIASVASGDGRYRALEDFLDRAPPRLAGRAPATPVLAGAADVVAGCTDAVARLDDSYLFVQGPPGAGKTYTASHAIVSLLADGRRVGVSSNSHKAIDNLLGAVDARAAEQGVAFEGLKKATRGQDDPFADSARIRTVYGNDDVEKSDAVLIAGTAWLFAREAMGERLDYLFIDEAGQVSLANLIAMGLAARNLVLVGDQMQLAQPIQGAHPGESGLSALEYLLEGHATVGPERGIFLDTSWRMHPDVCTFISDLVYDGRLHAHPDNARQALVLDGDAHPALAPSGIGFVPVEHSGCGQRSDEEADVVAEIWRSAIGQRYRDRDGNEHAMMPKNVLVVAPYNAQVNRLKQVLPEDARVGTVDRFQGQEAEVVIVSMTTSGDEELPRGVEFLLSRNRLNVALSRARTLALVVASPTLAEIEARSVEEMALVNTLCRLRVLEGGSPDAAPAPA